jgi:hypothetical protein
VSIDKTPRRQPAFPSAPFPDGAEGKMIASIAPADSIVKNGFPKKRNEKITVQINK